MAEPPNQPLERAGANPHADAIAAGAGPLSAVSLERPILADARVAQLSLAKLGLRVYWFPGCMLLVGLIPLVNAFAYSLHGGPGWLALPFTLPFVLVRLGMVYWRGDDSLRRHVLGFAAFSLPIYVVATAPLSWAATYSINGWLGTTIRWHEFWELMLMPFSLAALLFR